MCIYKCVFTSVIYKCVFARVANVYLQMCIDRCVFTSVFTNVYLQKSSCV